MILCWPHSVSHSAEGSSETFLVLFPGAVVLQGWPLAALQENVCLAWEWPLHSPMGLLLHCSGGCKTLKK